MPLISVVIPAYNRADLIGRAIKSVQIQAVDDLEIVVVDDGSADDTVSVVEELSAADRRIRLIKHAKNSGEAAARNTGVRQAQGELIAFLDSDDEWLPGKLRRQAQVLDENRTADVVVTGNIVVAPDGSRAFDDAWHFHLPLTTRNLLVHGCAVGLGGNTLMRSDAVRAAGDFDESLPLFVDVDWLCRFLDRSQAVTVPEPYTIYYKAPPRRGDPVLSAARMFLAKHRATIERLNAKDQRLVRAAFNRTIAASYLLEGRNRDYARFAARALLANPQQRIGNYVELIDAVLGTSLVSLGRRLQPGATR